MGPGGLVSVFDCLGVHMDAVGVGSFGGGLLMNKFEELLATEKFDWLAVAQVAGIVVAVLFIVSQLL